METHKINRAILELEFPSLETAFKSREQIAGELIVLLERSVEKLYSRIPDRKELIEIDRLEIDLGIIEDQDLEKLELKLDEILDQKMRQYDSWNAHVQHENIKATELTHTFPLTVVASGNPDENNQNRLITEIEQARNRIFQSVALVGVQSSADQRQKEKLMIFYLEEGYLPWWASDINPNLEEIAAELIRLQSLTFKQLVTTASPDVLKRLALKFSRHTHELLAAANLVPESSNEKNKLSAQQASIRLINIRGKLRDLLVEVRNNLIARFAVFAGESLAVQLLDLFGSASQVQLYCCTNEAEFEQACSSITKKMQYECEVPSLKELKTLRKAISVLLKETWATQKESQKQFPSSEQLVEFKIHRQFTELKRTEKACRDMLLSDLESAARELPEKGLILENAGVVILAPYLQNLFENLNLLNEEGKFKSVRSAFKAVLAFHYMCGETNARKLIDSPLYKILAGLDHGVPIPAGIALSPVEKKEIRSLLQAVLKNWSALKSSSVKSMQVNFFYRKAVLRKADKHFSLVIERKDFDILLDMMPWTFNIIRFPWFKDYFIEVLW